MSLLEGIHGPRDLDGLSQAELTALAQEIRDFLVLQVSKTGGHLGPNLGVVELTMAIHSVFDSPTDAIPSPAAPPARTEISPIWDSSEPVY